MIIGVPKEVKNRENRVAAVPGGVKMLVDAGNQVLVEKELDWELELPTKPSLKPAPL